MPPPLVVSGSAHRALAVALAGTLNAGSGTALADCLLQRFPDGEVRIELATPVEGRPVFLVQPLCPPVGEHLLELLLLADACRSAGAQGLTAVVPYAGYARQDRRSKEGTPLGARVIAQALGPARFERVLALDLHSPVIAACFEAPLVHLSAVGALAEALRSGLPERAVVVSPDLGGMKLAEAYARALSLPLAAVHKTRLSGSVVRAGALMGEVAGLAPVIVDDMISTGGTVAAACEVLIAHGARAEITVAATHGLFVGEAVARLARPEIVRVLTSDSLPPPAQLPARHRTVPIAPLLAEAVRRLLGGHRLEALLFAR